MWDFLTNMVPSLVDFAKGTKRNSDKIEELDQHLNTLGELVRRLEARLNEPKRGNKKLNGARKTPNAATRLKCKTSCFAWKTFSCDTASIPVHPESCQNRQKTKAPPPENQFEKWFKCRNAG